MTHFIGGRQNGQKKIKRERKREEGTSPGQDSNKNKKWKIEIEIWVLLKPQSQQPVTKLILCYNI